MSSTALPYGMKPAKKIGSTAFPAAMTEVPMTVNSATAIFTGDPIAANSGSAVAIAATPTTTRSTSTPIGICIGVRYTDPITKQEMHSQYLPAGAITAGYTNVFIKVVDDPDAIFRVQADGTVAATSLGKNAALQLTAGNATFGRSNLTLSAASVATTATLAVRIVGFATDPGSVVGDAFTDCLVVWNQGVHAYRNATGG